MAMFHTARGGENSSIISPPKLNMMTYLDVVARNNEDETHCETCRGYNSPKHAAMLAPYSGPWDVWKGMAVTNPSMHGLPLIGCIREGMDYEPCGQQGIVSCLACALMPPSLRR